MSLYRVSVAVFGVAFVVIGIALLAVTAAHGGAVFGFLIGVLFIALGLGRLYLLRSRR
jgi:hypothetical protein